MDSITGISYYLTKMLDASNLSLMTILSFSKTLHPGILRSTQSNCSSAKLSTSFLLICGPITVQMLNSTDSEI